MALSKQEVRQVIAAIRNLRLDAPILRVEDFIGSVLRLNPIQQAQYFPSSDPTGLLEIAVAHLTEERERILRDDCNIPDFAVFQDVQKHPCIAGLDTYLAFQTVDAKLRSRLLNHRNIRRALRRIGPGHNLEAVAAAIMNVECDYGVATRGSGDQGIDAIGWKQLVVIHPCFSDGAFPSARSLPGEKAFLFASSKAFTDGRDGQPSLISPAHIRELVGGWVIQRSNGVQERGS
jgi:hypothetical protein